MKPPRFIYHDPTTRGEVLSLLETYGDEAKVLAGGQSLVPLLNMRLAQPARVIDINRLSDLSYIREVDGGLAIGALTRQRDVEHSPLVCQRCPLLASAISYVGHAPIRSRGTIGGSLAHADPAAELPVVLMALGGHVRAESTAGSREIPAQELFVSQLQTSLTSQELVTEAWFPIVPPYSGAAFIEVSRRHGDYALVGVAAQLTMREDSTILAAHLALMGVAETPVRLHEAEVALVGRQPDDKLFNTIAELSINNLKPETDLHASEDYRRSVAGELVNRALRTALDQVHQRGKA
ncbi:MAG: xanthine dehydrogenase family protein subunit M [Ktedonobacteraceae bacterium]